MNLLTRSSAVLLSTLVPGAGLMLIGRWQLACAVQICLLAATVILCGSREVFEPLGIRLFLGMTAILYLLSLGLCFTSPLSLAKRRFAQVTYTAGFMLVSLVIFSCGFIYKHHWLGIHIYFVPSMSMYPTLKPGHFILLDTWVYRDVAPQLNDVVVFQHDGEGQWLVKRLSNWPDGELQHHDLFYMLGDNRRVSLDSRSFGGIAEQQLVGKVRLVLLGIDQKHQLVVDSLLKPVQ